MEDALIRVPETFEGHAVLHEFFTVDWSALKKLPPDRRRAMAEEWSAFQAAQNGEGYRTAHFATLGHKGDLLFIHFRKSYDELLTVQTAFRQLAVAEYLTKSNSYVSVVELGMYDYTGKLEAELTQKGLKPETDEWNQAWKAAMEEQRTRILGRLYGDIPQHKYVCFYPMNKKRSDQANWYAAPMKRRQAMMRDHGMIGRKYGGRVTQVISGSIGYDDWEWGVDLFSDDPLVFKKLVYEMRFDEASAVYGEFGPFFFGLHLPADKTLSFLEGRV